MVKKTYIPDRGDIIKLNFSPQAGKEQKGFRPALVVSPMAYNKISNFILACPVTNSIKGWRFEVVLSKSMKTSGVVLADQVRVLDWKSRGGRFIEKADSEILQEVLAKIRPLIT